MPGIKIKNEKNHTVIFLPLQKGQHPNESEAIEISRSGVRGLLKPKFEKHAFSEGFSYLATPSIPLCSFLQRPISKPDLLFIIGQFAIMPKKLSAKRLPSYKVLFDTDKILINEITKELQFLFLPVNGFRADNDYRKVLLEILSTAKPKDVYTENTLSSLTREISSFTENTFNLTMIENLLKREDKTISSMINTMNGGQSGYLTSDRLDALNHLDVSANHNVGQYAGIDRPTYQTDSADDGLLNEDATGILVEDDEPTGLLIEEPTDRLFEETDDYQDNDVTGLLAEEEEPTGLLLEEDREEFFEEDDATGLLTEEEDPTGLLPEEDQNANLSDERGADILLYSQADNEQNGGAIKKINKADSPENEKPKKFFSALERLKHKQNNGINGKDEGTEIKGGDDQKGISDEEATIHFPTLYRIRTDEKVAITKPVFRIGKEKTYVDFFVSGNETVSRSHADIIIRGQRCFVRDLNSKNRTFINDLPIKPDTEFELFDGDYLRLANEDFRFNK